jgi:hypothetical protein
MDRARKPWLRGAIALGVMGAMAASVLISPASAHLGKFGHMKKHIKKIATQRINALVPAMITAADNLRETKMFTLADGGSQTILTHGPFTITANCDLDAAGQDTANILISTTQDNSSFDAWDENDDFDIADPATERNWGADISVPANTTEVEANVGDGVAVAPDGTTLVLVSLYTAVNPPFAADRCAFAGANVLA